MSVPEAVHAGLRLERLGRSSIVYHVALFRESDTDPAAVGRFVHVYVDARTREVVPVPEPIRRVVSTLPPAEGAAP
jgi:acyl-CoA thioester hydrolase